MKKFAWVLLAGMVLFACKQQATQQETVAETVAISALLANPIDFENKEVRIEGVINHVCRKSGDKMRVAEPAGEGLSVLVMLGELAAQINPEFEGKEVSVIGVVKTRIGNMEALEAVQAETEGAAPTGEEGHECASTTEAIEKMKAAGINPEVIAFMEIKSFEVK